VLRRLLPATCALSLAAAACGRPNIVVRSQEPQGPSWFSLVVDTEQNSGAGLSLTTDADGNPHLAYLAFPEEPPPGEEPPAPDPLAPKLPAVMHAHLEQDVWTRGPVAEEQKADDTNTTAIAVDADGVHHVAWTTSDGVSYASNAEGDFGDPEGVASTSARGISIAVGQDGTPWIAYYEEPGGAEGPAALVRVATPGKRGWEVDTAAEAGPGDPASTAIAVGDQGPLVAYGSEGRTLIARQQGSRWVSETVDQAGGLGVSMALDADGNVQLGYFDDGGAVTYAHQAGGRWETADVGTGAAGSPTSVAVDAGGVHHVTWQTAEGLAYASDAGGDFAEETLPQDTAAGVQPKLGAGAEGVVYLAWYDPQDTELQMAVRAEEEPLLAVPSPEETGGGAAPAAACQPDGTELSITAQNIAFDKECLAVPAGQPFTIDFDNQDQGTPHNVAIYDAPGGTELFKGEIVTGPTTTTYQVDAIDQEGELHFQCDVHPTTMTGTFVVAAAGGGSGAGGGGGGGG
jgi:plastocyanin